MQSGEYWVLLTISFCTALIWLFFLHFCTFQQCISCEIGNLSMMFYSSSHSSTTRDFWWVKHHTEIASSQDIYITGSFEPLLAVLVMFLSKSKSIMTTKGMSLLARGSKGNWELLASILAVGKRIPKHSDFVLVFGNPLSYYLDFGQ